MTMRRVYLLVLAAAVGGCSFQSSSSLYRQGELEMQQGHFAAALVALTAAIDENPRFTSAYLTRAAIYRQQGRIDKAASDYEAVVGLVPYDFSANYELGVLYLQLRKFAAAVGVFKRAVDIRPGDAQANMNLALSYMQNGEPLQGLFYAQRAVQVDGKSAVAYANLGVLYAQTQAHASAIEAFKHALELDGREPEVYLDLGQEYFSTQAYEQARNVLETAHALAPSTRVCERLGATYYHLHQLDKAEGAYREALRLERTDVAALNGLGATLMSQALLTPSANTNAARDAVNFWKQSLALDKNQPAIENLVNQYAPRE